MKEKRKQPKCTNPLNYKVCELCKDKKGVDLTEFNEKIYCFHELMKWEGILRINLD